MHLAKYRYSFSFLRFDCDVGGLLRVRSQQEGQTPIRPVAPHIRPFPYLWLFPPNFRPFAPNLRSVPPKVGPLPPKFGPLPPNLRPITPNIRSFFTHGRVYSGGRGAGRVSCLQSRVQLSMNRCQVLELAGELVGEGLHDLPLPLLGRYG